MDTHVLIWLLAGDARLGTQARSRIEQAARDNALLVSAITPWEIAMLVSKGRLALPTIRLVATPRPNRSRENWGLSLLTSMEEEEDLGEQAAVKALIRLELHFNEDPGVAIMSFQD